MDFVPLLAAAAPSEEATFNATEWVFLSELPLPLIVAAGLAALASLWWSWRGTRGAPTGLRLGLFGARSLLVLGVFVLLLEPGQRLLSKSRVANRVITAVDVSRSMALRDGSGTTRVQRAVAAWRELREDLDERGPPFALETYGFDVTSAQLGAEALENLGLGATTPDGSGTHLLSALTHLSTENDDRPLGGVVLVSDGADSSGLGSELVGVLQKEAARLGVPIHTVFTGDATGFKDIAVDEIVADDFAFVRNKVVVQVVVRHTGFANLELPVTLKEDGRPLLVQRETLGDGPETRFELTFEPKAAGKHVYSIALPLQPEEGIVENNRADFTLKVIRDRIRVLQVAGRPSWDQRFVRRLLKENPSVDLISFFILRSPTDVAGAPSTELSLIPFPTRELFTEELHTFDVVIFQDFNYRPYQMGLYLQNVKEFVENAGGGFLMLGGELSFSEGEYDGTPVADILPVRLLPGRGHLSTERFTPLLSEAGRRHPVTDLGELAGGGNPYASLPALEGINLVLGLADDSEALLVHPFLNSGGGPSPVVAAREVGKGRSLAVLTDSTWLWSLPHVGAGGRGDAHRRFFANALRWLIRDPELSRVRVRAVQPEIEPGEEVLLEVRSFDQSYKSDGGAAVEVQLTALDATVEGATAETLQGETGPDGIWRASFRPPLSGAWRVSATAQKQGTKIGSDDDAFIVRSASSEALRAEPRPDTLRAIAEATGGRFVDAADVTSLPFLDHRVDKVHRQQTQPLWHHWLSLAFVIGAGCIEWYLRRRHGFA
ncbi:MAG: glutamine amidotransferase [Myxococcota bacterium]